ncbi:MAG TPA: AMP-binding protein [Acidimicrobiales bacterium]|nr:AMP-binding protein [Acidimicrobiales bacterium]
MEINLASTAEAVADHNPEQLAAAQGPRRLTWAQLEDRASRLACAFAALGLGQDSKVGSYLYNSIEYLEGLLATFKVRSIPVNVNYRYLEEELAYLIDNADLEVLLFHGSLGERVARVRDRLPGLKAIVQVDDGYPLVEGALSYDDLVHDHAPADRVERSGSDMLFLYTGGTTGMPKGVMWRQDDLLGRAIRTNYAALGFPPPQSHDDLGRYAATLAERGMRTVTLPASPIMHGSGLGAALGTMAMGGQVVLLDDRRFDPHELWRAVQEHRVTQVNIVGDPFARPMVRALEEAEGRGEPYDLTSIQRIASTGAMWSMPVKQELLKRADVSLVDNLAASEALAMGRSITTRQGSQSQTAQFKAGDHAAVITEDGRLLEPGSDEVGMLAVGEPIPVGYYKDPEKSARTFRQIGGRRWSVPGDYARVEADGTIVLLGRGSVCINTGGEKVFPEEVEEVVKERPGVQDCLVVGLEDETWGQVVVAVVTPEPGAELGQSDVTDWVRSRLASYKQPRRVVFVSAPLRGPNGKADYGAARRAASEAPAVSVGAD